MKGQKNKRANQNAATTAGTTASRDTPGRAGSKVARLGKHPALIELARLLARRAAAGSIAQKGGKALK